MGCRNVARAAQPRYLRFAGTGILRPWLVARRPSLGRGRLPLDPGPVHARDKIRAEPAPSEVEGRYAAPGRPEQRLWYARQTVEHGWSRAVLVHWIESDLYVRQGKALTNFSRSPLPARHRPAHRRGGHSYLVPLIPSPIRPCPLRPDRLQLHPKSETIA
jgi:hypothetical protein